MQATAEPEEPEHAVAAALSTVQSTAEDIKAVLSKVQAQLQAGAEGEDTDMPWAR